MKLIHNVRRRTMSVAYKIQKALKSIMTDGEANACHVFKGYEMGTGQNGWHYTPFGRNSFYLGKNENDAMEHIEMISDEQEEVKTSYLRSIR